MLFTQEAGVATKTYRITVRGRLTERFASAFEGMAHEPERGKTSLVGQVADLAPHHRSGRAGKRSLAVSSGPRSCRCVPRRAAMRASWIARARVRRRTPTSSTGTTLLIKRGSSRARRVGSSPARSVHSWTGAARLEHLDGVEARPRTSCLRASATDGGRDSQDVRPSQDPVLRCSITPDLWKART